MAESSVSQLRDGDGISGARARGNIKRHVAALSASKSADGLVDPKLVLSWLLTHLGAGAFWVGALVPVREAGALLPQLVTAGRIKAMARRKWAWAWGAVGQGAAAALMVVAALTLDGAAAGAVILGLLALLALARSVCSVSYKDVLGKTVAKTRRGRTTGLASTAASVTVISFAALLMAGWGDKPAVVVSAIALAALLWVAAGAIMAGMSEDVSDEEAGDSAAPLRLLLEQPQLARFVLTRGLLVGTALAPPYLVLLAGGDGVFSALGALVLASSLAALLSSYVWGWLADRLSRRVLVYSGVAGAVTLAAALLLQSAGWAMPVVLFGLMIAYHGVRQGRSTYLVDMADEADRAAYTAVSNTATGLLLLAAGAVAASLATFSVPLVIGGFAVMCLGGAVVALGLEEVEHG